MYKINRPSVMVSGSRGISTLPQEALLSLDKIADQGFRVLVGDARGVDYEVQKYLKSLDYPNVTVHLIGRAPRNAIPDYPLIAVPGNYFDRDAYMGGPLAQYGLAIWDGKSRGTRLNIDRVPLTRVITVPGRIANIQY